MGNAPVRAYRIYGTIQHVGAAGGVDLRVGHRFDDLGVLRVGERL